MNYEQPMLAFFVFLLALVMFVVGKKLRSGVPFLRTLDDVLLGLVALLSCIPFIFPRTKTAAEIGLCLLLVRYLWTAFQRFRPSDRPPPGGAHPG